MSQDFNPNSFDAQFARVLQVLEEHSKRFEEKRLEDKDAYAAIMAKQDLTNGRVNRLEEWKAHITGKVAGISLGVSAVISLVAWGISTYVSS